MPSSALQRVWRPANRFIGSIAKSVGQRLLTASSVVAMAVVVAIWSALLYDLHRSENVALEQGRRDVSNLSIAFREHISGVVGAIDQLMMAIVADHAQHPNEYQLPRWVTESPILDGLALQVAMLGPDGIVQFTNLPSTGRVDVSDRPHFRHHLDPAAPQPYISVPVLGRVSKKWSVQFTRRLTLADGRFDGVVLVSVDPVYLANFFNDLDLGSKGIAILIGQDGIVRARHSHETSAVGQDLSKSMLFQSLRGRSEGTFIAPTQIDQVERVVGFAGLKHYPLAVAIGMASDDLLVNVHRKARFYIAAGLFIALLIAGATWALLRDFELRRERELELHTQAQLAEQKKQLDIALNNMSSGLVLFDSSERLTMYNQRYLDLYGISADAVKPGCTFRELLEYRKATGTFDFDVEEYSRSLLAGLKKGERKEAKFTLDDRTFYVVNDPLPGGGWVSTHREITKQQRAEQELTDARHEAERAHEEAVAAHARLLEAFNVVPEGLALFDREDRYVLWNQRYLELYPDSAEHIVAGKRFEDVLRAGLEKGQYPAARGREEQWLAERLSRHADMKSSHEQALPGDRWLRVEERRTADGGSIGVRIDITELKKREESFRLLFENNPVPMWVLDPESQHFLAVNDAAVAHYGYSREQFLRMTAFEIRPPNERAKFAEFLKTGHFTQGDKIWQHQKADGTPIHVLVYTRALKYQGHSARINAIVDVTQRKYAEDELKNTREFLNAVIQNVPVTVLVKKADDLRYVLINKTGEDYFGVKAEQFVGKTAADLFPPAAAQMIKERDEEILRSREPAFIDDHALITPRGEERIVTASRVPILDDDGKPQYVLGVIQDVTDNRKAKQALIESEQMARGIVNTALDAFIQMDEAGLITEWNTQAEAVFGWTQQEAVGQLLSDLIVPPAQRRRHAEGLTRFLKTGESKFVGRRFEIGALHRDGREIKVEIAITALNRGGKRTFNAFIRDITQRLAADEQLRQAQKMEAVGNLTGGLAHDFNNLLTVIIGNLDLLIDDDKIAAESKGMLDTILKASERGATLTRQMLAFSRRQSLKEDLVEVNNLIQSAAVMLDRTLGENVKIDLRLASELWTPRVDAAQLETAIVNIAINARDAMPTGGTVMISTRNLTLDGPSSSECHALPVGDYVEIAISDTGTGMSREVLDRVFEPFFTTKAPGAGTGLGLSMVYGFMKQSNGHISAESKLGAGTTFKMYFPRCLAAPASEEIVASTAQYDNAQRASNHDKVILTVDDNPVVRETVVAQLKEFGYTVIEASDAAAALRLLDSEKKVDLLFTDVVMPGALNGKQLAKQARDRRANLRVLFTSGYPKLQNGERGTLEEGDELLSKPYRKRELAEAIRRALA